MSKRSCFSTHRLVGARGSRGFTLVEVLIASVILAIIGTMTYQTLSQTIISKEVIEDNLQKLVRVDRAWVLFEGDLRNALSHVTQQSSGPGTSEAIAPMILQNGEEYWMTMLRGGHANPLNFLRTELIRVGYRVQEDTLWRDVWYNLGSVDVEQARSQKIIENVAEVRVEILPYDASSYSAGPWLDRWPKPGGNQDVLLPLAIRVSLQLKGEEGREDPDEITRVFSIVKGE